MFENSEKTNIEKIGKNKLIAHILSLNENKNPQVIVPPGDDAAIIKFSDNENLVVSSNIIVENVNFDLVYTPLKHLGYKTVTTTISNIYAMNAKPEYILINIAFSSKYTLEAIEEIYSGIYFACNKYNIILAGGDINTSVKGLTLSATAIGKICPNKEVLRQNCKVSDILCVTGDLGAAYMGYHLLEREKRVFLATPDFKPDIEGYDYIVSRQLKPEARNDIIELFEKENILPTSMTDLSSGLADGLKKISSKSKIGFDVFEEKLPIDGQTLQLANEMNLDATMCILNGGEDYELLFTIGQIDYEKIKNNIDITAIGYATSNEHSCNLITKDGSRKEIRVLN
ncbi:MAG: thiamine-phosphate kinase [Bacteroidetes bacterium]|nr:thiamine-phosphate kinase [Bacteroidota bacterium]